MNTTPEGKGLSEATIAQMRQRDRHAGNGPWLTEQAAIMGDTLHWSTTHSWPSIRTEMIDLGVVRVIAAPKGDFFGGVTEITDLGREVRAALQHEGGGRS